MYHYISKLKKHINHIINTPLIFTVIYCIIIYSLHAEHAMIKPNKKSFFQAISIITIALICAAILSYLLIYFPSEKNSIVQTKNYSQKKKSKHFLWKTAYDIQFDGNIIDIKVFIKLVRATDVRKIQIEQVKDKWLHKIHSVWSKQYALQTTSGQHYPIHISAKFVRLHPHHEIIIRSQSKKIDEYNWSIHTSPYIISHEFGHMIGAFDEYPSGAIDPQTQLIDLTSIMGRAQSNSTSYARHYKSIQQWFSDHVEQNSTIIKIKTAL